MDPFTLTDDAGTFAFDGTQGVFTSADGGAAVTFTAAPATPASVTVTDTDGKVFAGTLAAQ